MEEPVYCSECGCELTEGEQIFYFDDLCPELGKALKKFHGICPSIQIKELHHSEIMPLRTTKRQNQKILAFFGGAWENVKEDTSDECSEEWFDYLTNRELKRHLGNQISNMLKLLNLKLYKVRLSKGKFSKIKLLRRTKLKPSKSFKHRKKNLFIELGLFKPDFLMFSAKNKEVIIWPNSTMKLISSLFEIHYEHPNRDRRYNMDLLSLNDLQRYHEHVVSIIKKYNLGFMTNSFAFHYSKTAVGYAKQL